MEAGRAAGPGAGGAGGPGASCGGSSCWPRAAHRRLEGPCCEAATRGPGSSCAIRCPGPGRVRSQPTLWYAVRSRRRDGTPRRSPTSSPGRSRRCRRRPGRSRPRRGRRHHPDVAGEPRARATWSSAGRLPPSWEVAAEGLAYGSFLDTDAPGSTSPGCYRVRAVVDGVWGPPSAEVRRGLPGHLPAAGRARTSSACPRAVSVRLRWDPRPEPGCCTGSSASRATLVDPPHRRRPGAPSSPTPRRRPARPSTPSRSSTPWATSRTPCTARCGAAR